jgi:glycine/D-amino acid oxidase-like deaminating enzyme
MHAAEARGAVLRHDTAVDLVCSASGAVRGVALASGEIVEGDAVVIAMGPWSILAARWLPLPAVFGYKGHSLVFETGGDIPAEALFLEYREASGEILTPELFPRADGTTWVCAISTLGPLPVDPAPRSPPRRSRRGKRVSGRSLRTACRSSAPYLVLTASTWRPATVSGACSTRPRPARR